MYLWVIKCNYYYRLYKNSGSQATQSREGTPFLKKKLSKRKPRVILDMCILNSCFSSPPHLFFSHLTNVLIFLIFEILY